MWFVVGFVLVVSANLLLLLLVRTTTSAARQRWQRRCGRGNGGGVCCGGGGRGAMDGSCGGFANGVGVAGRGRGFDSELVVQVVS